MVSAGGKAPEGKAGAGVQVVQARAEWRRHSGAALQPGACPLVESQHQEPAAGWKMDPKEVPFLPKPEHKSRQHGGSGRLTAWGKTKSKRMCKVIPEVSMTLWPC